MRTREANAKLLYYYSLTRSLTDELGEKVIKPTN